MWSKTLRTTALLAIASAAGMAGGAAARADGYPPFFGYSPYFGGPATYFTRDDTIHEVVKPRDGEYGFGTRTYYRGGPFWGYQPTPRRRIASGRGERRGVVLRRRY